ncbi:MAG: hypothetical protein PUC65_16035 [Clostridiales bacterium]|nr:hypothetical protein [Clostridiales bacterium]
MDNSLKGLMLAAGVVITCIVVGLGFYISREAKNTSSGGISQITKMNSEYQDISMTMYDGIKVSGREVVEAVEKYKDEISNGDFSIVVFTGKKTSATGGIVFDSKNYPYDDTKQKKNTNYINPDGNFLGETSVDSNGVVTVMTFKQQ